MKKRILSFLLLIQFILLFTTVSVNSAEGYEDFARRIADVDSESGIEAQGFEIIEEQRFTVEHKTLGLIELVPSIDRKYGRVVLFFIDQDGEAVFKTDKLESNSWFPGQTTQPNTDVLAVSFSDLNGDGLDDLIIICGCVNSEGSYAGKQYTVGDVLFQNENGFYRDWRISDKLNRFDMNKNAFAVAAFVRDGESLELLHTARTTGELVAGGFETIEYQSFTAYFETFGVVRVISGFYYFGWRYYFMVYVAGEDGKILWNFQPMGDYVNFYSVRGISFTDIDGDGLKDITILANYVTYDDDGNVVIKSDYNVYYQRTGFFVEDIEVKREYTCTDNDSLGTVIQGVRRFWGWGN